MKRIISIISVLTVLLCSLPMAFNSMAATTISSNAAEVFLDAISNGQNNGTAAWTLETGSTVANQTVKAASLSNGNVYLNGGGWLKPLTNVTHKAYSVDDGTGNYSLTAYDENTFTSLTGADTLPSQGLLFSMRTANQPISATYTVTKKGKVKISDPTGNGITSVSKINSTTTNSFWISYISDSFGNRVYTADFAIYKNGEKLWPTNTEWYTFGSTSQGGGSNTTVDFPTLNDISVNAGDKIRFVFKNTCYCAMALNPQIDLTPDESQGPEIPNPPVTEGEIYNAADSILAALEKDTEAGKVSSIYTDTQWSIQRSTTGFSEGFYALGIESPVEDHEFKFNTFTFATNPWTRYFHDNIAGYTLSWSDSFGAYNSENADTIITRDGTSVGDKGLIVSTISKTYTAFTYTFEDSGKATLHDPNYGFITNVMKVNDKLAYSIDTTDKAAYIAIYLNDQKLWPQDSDYAELNIYSPSIAFPTIQDITVRKKDELRIVIKNELKSGAGNAVMCVALNPQINLTVGEVPPLEEEERFVEDAEIMGMITNKSTNNLAETFRAAIDADIINNTLNYVSTDSPWSVQKSTSSFYNGYSELSPWSVKEHFYYNNFGADGWPDISEDNYPSGYEYGWYSGATTFDTDNKEQAKLFTTGNLPTKGFLLYFSEANQYHSVTYTAKQPGTVSLYDPDGADIAAISRVGSNSTNSLDTANKKLHIAIYKNDQKIWPADSDYFEFGSSLSYVAFPDLQGIQVDTGDTIRIAFVNRTPHISNMLIAMNPQVDFIPYTKVTHTAQDEVNTSIESDIEVGTDGYAGNTQISKLYSEYLWRIEEKTDDEWTMVNPIGIDKLVLSGADGGKLPNVLKFPSVSIGKYMRSFSGIEAPEALGDSGLLISVDNFEKPISFTYTVTDDRFIRIRDLTNGFIQGITKYAGVEIDNDFANAGVKLSIYKNDEKLWSEDNFNGKVQFPDISFATEESDKIRLIVEVENPDKLERLLLALNPSISGYSVAVSKVQSTEIGAISSHNAHAEISAVIKNDTADGSLLSSKTNWQMQYSSDLKNWTKDELGYSDPEKGKPMTYVETMNVYNAADVPTGKWPLAYAYNWDRYLAPFDVSNSLKAFNISRLPKTGIVTTTMGRSVYYALTFVADKSGELHIYDPNNGYITAIQSIDNINLRSCDYDPDFSKNVEIAIYKNNEKIWPTDSDSIVFNSRGANEEKAVFFPNLVGVDVKKGDAIRFVIHSVGDSDTIPAVIAMNPQIDYTAVDHSEIDWGFTEREYNKVVTETEYITNKEVIPGNSGYTETITSSVIEDDDNKTSSPARRKKKIIKIITNNSTAWIWILVGSISGGVALLAAAGVTILLILKKKGKILRKRGA